MGQIIITRKDGTKYPLAVKKEATDIKESRQSWGLLGDDVVNVTVESPYPQHYDIGDYFSVFGRTYKLNQLPRVRKLGMHKYAYELTFEGVQYDLLRAFYDVTIETTGNTLQDVQGDALTGNLYRFATVLVANANRVFPSKWKLGACPDTMADKTLTFGDGDNCLAVYQNLCRTFDVEADITQQDGVYTINFYKRVGTTHPFVFEFGKGKGLYALDRQNVDSSNIVTRLKVFGSDDNITNKYRANRLCLPGKSKAQSFIEQSEAVQKYGIHEARKIFEDIKPTFDGTVTDIVAGSVLQFKDTSMFDLNAKEDDGKTTKYLVAGVSAKIHFNTGNLAGYEFDIHKYDHATRTFTLKKLTDDRGDVFPSETSSAFQFAKGDKYKILDVTLPERYQQEAERKLQERANEYYKQNSQPKVKYGLSVAKSYLKKLFEDDAQVSLFSPGDYINVKDESIGVDKAIRIQSLVRNLLDVYDYTLTLSDIAENNITTRVISELVEIDKITTTHQLKDPTRAKANWRSSREVINMVFDPDGDYYTDKIKPNSIDTLALSVGAKSMQFALQDVVFEPNFQGLKNNIRVSAGTLTHYAIEEQPRMWAIAEAITDLPEDESAYYIFARCNKVNNVATIVFNKTPIKVEELSNAYHFWIGVVNSVDPALQARSIALSYGFSMINGRFIKTGRIESADGRTYFDLDEGEIGGNIKFRGFDNQSRTEVSGGLLLTEALLLRDKDGKVRAMLNGRDQAHSDDVYSGIAFLAGITDFATEREHRVIEIKHSGDARFGLMNIEQTPMGSVITYLDPNTESVGPLLRIGGSQTPLSDLIDRSGKTSSIRVPEQTITMSQTAQVYQGGRENARKTIESSERVVVPKTGKARIRCRIELELDVVRIPPEAPHAYSSVEIGIGGGIYRTSQFIRSWDTNGDRLKPFDRRKTFEIDETIDNIPAGTYSVSVTAILAVYGQDHSVAGRSYASLTARIGAIQVDILSVDTSVREVVFGSEGLSAFFGHNRFVYLSRHPDLPVLSARGRVNLPGVILSGYVATDRVIRTEGKNRHYALRQLYNPLGLNVVCYDFGSDGYFCITHNAGFEGLLPQITVVGGSDYASMLTTAVVKHISEISFQIWIANNDRGMQRQDFIFTLIGTNY